MADRTQGTFAAIVGSTLVAQEAGLLTVPLSKLIGLALLSFAVVPVQAARFEPRRRATWFGLALTAAGFVGLWASASPDTSLASAAMVALALPLALGAPPRRAATAVVLAAWVFAVVVAHPYGFQFLDAAAVRVSGLLSWRGSESLQLGLAYLPLLPGLAAAVAVVVATRGRERWVRFGATLVGLLGAYAAYVNFLAGQPEFETAYPSRGFFASRFDWEVVWRSARLTLQPLLLTALVAFVPGLVLLRRRYAPEGGVLSRRVLAGATGAVLAGSLALTPGRPAVPESPPLVTFYTPGFANWLKPDWGTYGNFSLGMLGMLPDFVERMGCRQKRVEAISRDVLAESRLLVFVNHNSPLPEEQYDWIDDFVRGGGRLLVVGDHTWKRGADDILFNRLVRSSRIRFRFDTANAFVGGWLHSYRYLATPFGTAGDVDLNRIGIVTGCSLDVEAPAWPIVVGKYGFSDRGDPGNARQGYLGNMRYEHGEKLGDVVLAAADRVGCGRVMAVGDTTSFSNPLLPHSHAHVHASLAWLLDDGDVVPGPWRACAGVVLLLAGIGVLMAALDAFPVVATVAVVLGLATTWRHHALEPEAPAFTGRMAYVDMSHRPTVAEESGMHVGPSGLMRTFVRAGYFPVKWRHFSPESMDDDDVLCLLAPKQPFTAEEGTRVLDFAARGGLVLICAGPEERDALAPLLDAMHVDITSTPLGSVSVTLYEDVRPLAFRTAYAIRVHNRATEVLVATAGRALIVRRRVGRGALVLAGDPRFFLNQNMETGSSYSIANVILLKQILSSHDSRE